MTWRSSFTSWQMPGKGYMDAQWEDGCGHMLQHLGRAVRGLIGLRQGEEVLVLLSCKLAADLGKQAVLLMGCWSAFVLHSWQARSYQHLDVGCRLQPVAGSHHFGPQHP